MQIVLLHLCTVCLDRWQFPCSRTHDVFLQGHWWVDSPVICTVNLLQRRKAHFLYSLFRTCTIVCKVQQRDSTACVLYNVKGNLKAIICPGNCNFWLLMRLQRLALYFFSMCCKLLLSFGFGFSSWVVKLKCHFHLIFCLPKSTFLVLVSVLCRVQEQLGLCSLHWYWRWSTYSPLEYV